MSTAKSTEMKMKIVTSTRRKKGAHLFLKFDTVYETIKILELFICKGHEKTREF